MRDRNRREFLTGIGASALLATLFGPAATLRAIGDGRQGWPDAPPEFFNPEQMRTLAALADRILPPGNGFPGAAAAGMPQFTDRMMSRLYTDTADREVAGRAFEELDTEARRASSGDSDFADLDPGAQDDVLRALQQTDWFRGYRGVTLDACFTLPDSGFGGNVDEAGWQLLGFEHRPVHVPPFGFYDRAYDEPVAPDPPDGLVPPPPAPGPPVRFDTAETVDFAIVGSGAAGGAVAWELARAGFSVVVLEQGPRLTRQDFTHDEIDVLQQDRLVNSGRTQPQTFRHSAEEELVRERRLTYGRVVGGGTVHFTANYWRFRPVDFREASLLGPIEGTGFADWPISYEELEPYYARAEYVVGVSGLAGAHPFDPPRSAPYPLPPLPTKSGGVLFERGARALGWHPFPAPMAVISRPYRGRPACQHCGFCQGFGCEWGAKSSSMESVLAEAEATGRCEIRPNSYVRKVETDRRGRATGVIYFDRERREVFQRARAVVVAANGAETPRLLLQSRSNLFPDGLANSSGVVGKYLMFNRGEQTRGLFEHPLNEWKSVQPSRVVWDFYDTDPERGFYGGGGVDARFGSRTPAIFATDLARAVEPGWGARFRDTLAHRFSRTVTLETHQTSLPLATNTVELDPELRDDWGLPAIRTTYRDHPDDLACSRFFIERSLEILEAAGARETWTNPVEVMGWSVHLLGTCRMGDDPATSVVNREHRAHDVPNLFVCDGSSFVTSGRGQPTCTISALGFRAGELMARTAARGEI